MGGPNEKQASGTWLWLLSPLFLRVPACLAPLSLVCLRPVLLLLPALLPAWGPLRACLSFSLQAGTPTQAGPEVGMEGGEAQEEWGEAPLFQQIEINPSLAHGGQPAFSLPFPPRS